MTYFVQTHIPVSYHECLKVILKSLSEKINTFDIYMVVGKNPQQFQGNVIKSHFKTNIYIYTPMSYITISKALPFKINHRN